MQSRCVRSGRIHFTTSVCTTLRSLGIGLCQIIKLEAAVAEPCHNLEQESAKAISKINGRLPDLLGEARRCKRLAIC
jgi:hypothetical protein